MNYTHIFSLKQPFNNLTKRKIRKIVIQKFHRKREISPPNFKEIL